MAVANALNVTKEGALALSAITTGKVNVSRAYFGTSKVETNREVNGLVEPSWEGSVESVSLVDAYTCVFRVRIKSSQVAQSTDYYECVLKTNQGVTFATAVMNPPVRFTAGVDCVVEMPLNFEAPLASKVDSLSVPQYTTIPAVSDLEFLPPPAEAGCTCVVVHNVYGDGEPVVATKTGNALTRWSFSGHYNLGPVALQAAYEPEKFTELKASIGWEGERLLLYVCAGVGYGNACVATQEAGVLLLSRELTLNQNSSIIAYRQYRNLLPTYTGEGGDFLTAKKVESRNAGLRLDLLRVEVEPNATSFAIPNYSEKYRELQNKHLVFDVNGLLNPTQSVCIGGKVQLAVTHPVRRDVIMGLFYYDVTPGSLELFAVSNTASVTEVVPVDNQVTLDKNVVALDSVSGKPAVAFTYAAGRFVPLENVSNPYCFIGQSFVEGDAKSAVYRADVVATTLVVTGVKLTSAVFFLNGVPSVEPSLNADGSVSVPTEHVGKALTIIGTATGFHTPLPEVLGLSWSRNSSYVTGGNSVQCVESSNNVIVNAADEVLCAFANGVYLSPNEYTFDGTKYSTEITGEHSVVFLSRDDHSETTDVITKHKFKSAPSVSVTLAQSASSYLLFVGFSCQPVADILTSVSNGVLNFSFPEHLRNIDCTLVEFKRTKLEADHSGTLTRRGFTSSYRPINSIVSYDDTLVFAGGAYVQDFSISNQSGSSVVVAQLGSVASYVVSLRSDKRSVDVTRTELDRLLNSSVF